MTGGVLCFLLRTLSRRVLATLVLSFIVLANAFAASVEVVIDLSAQTMRVSAPDFAPRVWKVSTARPGYRTPTGTFTPQRLERMWYSIKYDNAPMPWSIFFYGGYAIHGTTEISKLGSPASHGCVRLHPDNARVLFELVSQYGKPATLIRIQP